MDTTPKKKSKFKKWKRLKTPKSAPTQMLKPDEKHDYSDVMELMKEYEGGTSSPFKTDQSVGSQPVTPGPYEEEEPVGGSNSPQYVTWDFIKPAVPKDVKEAAKKIEDEMKLSKLKRKRKKILSPQIYDVPRRTSTSNLNVKDYSDIIDAFEKNLESSFMFSSNESSGGPGPSSKASFHKKDGQPSKKSSAIKNFPSRMKSMKDYDSLDPNLAAFNLTQSTDPSTSLNVPQSVIVNNHNSSSCASSVSSNADVQKPNIIQALHSQPCDQQQKATKVTHITPMVPIQSPSLMNQRIDPKPEPTIHSKAKPSVSFPPHFASSKPVPATSFPQKSISFVPNSRQGSLKGRDAQKVLPTETNSPRSSTPVRARPARPVCSKHFTPTPKKLGSNSCESPCNGSSSATKTASSPLNYMALLDDSFNDVLLQHSQEVEKSYKHSLEETTGSTSSSACSSSGNSVVKLEDLTDYKQQFLMDTEDDDLFALINLP